MENILKKIVSVQKEGKSVGIYSACTGNFLAIEAVLRKGLKDNSCVLIECTANQSDQFGGYTGKTPKVFIDEVYQLADILGFDRNKLFLGGDHLGPLTFAKYDEEKAMSLADDLIRAYVSAGFTKIHIDTSMKLASDDPDTRLSDEIIAKRSARLAKVAQETYRELLKDNPDAVKPVYVVGSEVPIPGGSTDNNNDLQITKPEDLNNSMKAFEEAYAEADVLDAWEEVIAFVVQPGVEEKDDGCVEYDRGKALALTEEIRKYDNIVYEGHSTDYQNKYKLRELVEDGFGILKVGPALTYALREGLFALSYIEDVLFEEDKRSNLRSILEEKMMENPVYWQKHYHGNDKDKAIKRQFSFSDRCRYYFSTKEVKEAVDKLMNNFENGVPLNLLSQFMPIQYANVRLGIVENKPKELVINRIENTIDDYLYATKQSELIK